MQQSTQSTQSAQSDDTTLDTVVFPLDVWGPRFWFTMHTVVMAYPLAPTSQEKQNMYDFFLTMSRVIPCPRCRVHFTQMLKENPIADSLGSQPEMMEWLWRVHNRVNADNNKPQITRRQANRHFTRLRQSSGTANASGNPSNVDFWTGVAAGVALSVGVVGCTVLYAMNSRR